MQNILGNETDRATMEMMMRHYRDELLRYQRATAPGKPTLAENIENVLPPQESEQYIEETEVIPEQAEPPEEIAEQEPICEEQEAEIEEEPPLQFANLSWREFHTEFEKATGAYGEFRPYERMGRYTMASFLQSPGKVTPVLARFASDVAAGGAEHSRCRKSFTVKFFCEDGEYDLPGGYLPVAAGVGEELQVACCGTTRADPMTGVRSAEYFWRFLSENEQALPMAIWLYSDFGTIANYRLADGYCPPCIWVNKEGERRAMRAMWLSRQRPRTLNRFEAEEMAGADPDAMSRDLFQTLKSGEKVQFELAVQIIEPQQMSDLDFDPFDPTEMWSKERFAVQRIGLLTLDRMAENVTKELSPERFCAENIIRGIEYADLRAGNGIETAGRQLKLMGEFECRTIAANMAEQLKRIPPEMMERILIMLTNAELRFGQMVTDMVSGGDAL
ncbi:MAG: catalase [Oscillospiraceae bacterium]|nr:catalase [Oscillospiraceae bacterium]